MTLPPALFIVLADFGPMGIGIAGDPVTTMDDAADQVAEFHKHSPGCAARVLRIADTLNTDDVTADAFEVIAQRRAVAA